MSYNTTTDGETDSNVSSDPQLIIDALRDEDSRQLVAEAGEQSQTAKELAEACDLSLSATYRRLERLTEAGLLSKGTRVRPGQRPAAEYSRNFDGVMIDIANDGTLMVRSRPTLAAHSD